MKRLIVAVLCASAGLALAQPASAPSTTSATSSASTPAPVSAAKKELVQRLLQLQQPGIEGMARSLVEQPAIQLTQAASRALQQVAPDKREAVGKTVDADIHKIVDDSFPLARERALKLAPTTIGAVIEEKFSEDELKQLIAWFSSPVSRKFSQLGQEMQSGFSQKLVAEMRPILEPKLQILESKVRADLGLPSTPPAPGASAAPSSSPAKALPPARKASAK